ncbi:hypothetical protein Salat_0578000 [Sesamum alatum]|uniref:Uncharacterized protein n=1 Tax=Sesamum alatum TaxID=300844 RepID=A0AAE1YQN2_9LAMI|nr:hypothetical protein Salat_0578000 [Sesamum alatum]
MLFMHAGTLQSCELKDLVITQKATGKTVENKAEWEASVSVDCPCTQANVKLFCKGFQTAEAVDSSLLSKSGDECLLNNGQPLYGSDAVSFVYAWDAPFDFKPVYSEVACS